MNHEEDIDQPMRITDAGRQVLARDDLARGAEKTEASAMRTATRIEAAFACPRTWCRGRLPHSLLVHWFGWLRR